MSSKFAEWGPMAATPLERWVRWGFVGILTAALVGIVVALLAGAYVEPVVMTSIVALLVMGFVGIAARRRSKRVLEVHGFRVCPRCLAPLTGAERCAACGYEHGSLEEVERMWKEWYGAGA